MIVIIHSKNIILECRNCKKYYEGSDLTSSLLVICNENPDEIIAWIDKEIINDVNLDVLQKCRKNEIIFYNPSKNEYMPQEIGWIDFRSAFLNINKNLKYATWQVSSVVGASHGNLFQKLKWKENCKDFDLFCAILGFNALKNGIILSSQPLLINKDTSYEYTKTMTLNNMFKFVRAHYTTRQYFFLFISYIIFKRKFHVIQFFKNLKRKNNWLFSFNMPHIEEGIDIKDSTIDVIIPTLGRESYLKDVLFDLNNQTHVPSRVIVVEQVSKKNKHLKYDLLDRTNWNFELIHVVIDILGACNARNVALKQVKSNWVFLGDDDIRLKPNTIESTINFLELNKIGAVSLASYQEGEKVDVNRPSFLWSEFSSGCSIVRREFLLNVEFQSCYEFGFGEDTDFGFQLRNKGCEVFYFNKVPIYHLKAPIGGFRTKVDKAWSSSLIKPFPEPTITLCAIKNYNNFQLQGFKLYYSIKNIHKMLVFGYSIFQIKQSFSYAKKMI